MAKNLSAFSPQRPRILLADDHTMLLDAFRRLLEAEFEIVGTAANGREVVELAMQTRPDVVVLDISMPQLNGMEAGAQLLKKLPGIKLVFLTVNEDPDVAAAAIRQGASGFLLKSSASAELISAIQMAITNKVYVTPLIIKGQPLGVFLAGCARPAAGRLTARQREVLQLLAEGRSMKEAGDLLKLTPRTVAFHKYGMMETLGLKTGAELVQYAVREGIVTPRA